jgi:ABC-type branched-subunit amino acid transport system permease subunit
VRNLARYLIQHRRDPNVIAYAAMAAGALIFPILAQFVTGGNGNFIISQAADAGVYVLLAIGLNVVVGFAGLLDLGYAAFFAIGAYTYALLASNQGLSTPLHHAFHLPFWVLLFVGMFIAAAFGATLGAPTLRLRGDYLAIVTLGFGEIVPRVFKNLSAWTSGVNGISALDSPGLPAWVVGPWADAADFAIQTNYRLTSANPTAYYVIMVMLLVGCVILVNNLYNSRLGRAWMAVREDEVAAAAMGVNTVTTKLLAFGIGAAFSGFAGAFYGAKLSLVSPENFGFTVSVTILVMVVLGGMGNIPGVMIGALLIYYVLFNILPNLPQQAKGIAEALGLNVLVTPTPGYPGLVEEVQRLKFLLFGIILVTVMVLRPQGLLPSRIRRAELKHEGTEPVLDVGTA